MLFKIKRIKNMGDSGQYILVFATAWGPKFGGINSFNKNFCSNLAKNQEDLKVVCLVSSCNVKEIEEAKNDGVDLLNLNLTKPQKFIEYNEAEGQVQKVLWEKYRDRNFQKKVSFVVLHDLSSGDMINFKDLLFDNARWIVFHHMNYNESIHIEDYEKNSFRYESIITQYDLFRKADIIFAVGPYLKDLLFNFLDNKQAFDEKPANIFEFIPGLDVNDHRNNPFKITNGLVYGRLDKEHDRVKLSSLVLKAWTDIMPGKSLIHQHVSKGKLTIIGFDIEKDKNQLKSIKKKFSNCVLGVDYTSDINRIKYSLGDASIAFLPSRHEGFGLTGWEAIATKVPLIVTKRSGLYKLLENEELTSNVQILELKENYVDTAGEPFDNDELIQLKSKIENYLNDIKGWQSKSEYLFEELFKKYSWDKCIGQFLETLKTNGMLVEFPKQEETVNKSSNFKIKDKNVEELSIEDFAQRCVLNHHGLILSHRTNIIEMKDAETYRLFRPFLNKFANMETNITNSGTGLNRTLLIFIVDFGGDYSESFDEQALYNCMTLQSTLKAICLVPPFGEHRKLHGDTLATKVLNNNWPDFDFDENEAEFTSHNLFLKGLSNRTVILVKNYKKYIKSLNLFYTKIDEKFKEFHLSVLISDGIKLINKEAENIPKINLTAEYILMNYLPNLEYLDPKYQVELSQYCTNVRDIKDNAFGLYATVKFDSFNDGKLHCVDAYSINRNTQTCKNLPFSNNLFIGEKKSLFKEEIENSMKYVTMSGAYFLEKLYWNKQDREMYWKDCVNRSKEFSAAYEAIERAGFHHLTLPQFLNIPIIFPEIIDEIKKKKI